MNDQIIEDDPFALGWREVVRRLPNGQVDDERIPLTLDDILHPEEGDCRVHSSKHERCCVYFYDVFTLRLHPDPQAVVLLDVRIAWDTPDIRPHTLDISVIFNVQAVQNGSTFDEAKEKTKPILVVEVTSPSTRKLDLETKMQQYAQVGLQYYIIVDTYQEQGQTKRRVLGYQLQYNRYQRMQANHRGWVWLPPLGVWLGIEDNEPYCYDELGQKIGDYPQIYLNLKLEEQARAKAEKEAADLEAKLRQMEAELRRLRNQD